LTGSQFAPFGGVSLGGLLVKARFGMSAPKAENGFAGKRIVSSQAARRNIRGGNMKDFNMRKIAAIEGGRFEPFEPNCV
jgi:hypothetical protein